MLTRDDMCRDAEEWVAAWNRRDLEFILAAFSPDATFRSPKAREVTGASFIKGRSAMAEYWTLGLQRLTHLQFTLIETICDEAAQQMVVLYDADLNGAIRRACELFVFRDGVKIAAEALYGD